MAKRIVVVGAAGLVGQNLIPLLVKKGYTIIALDKNERNLSLLRKINPTITLHQIDFAIKGKWSEYFKEADAVVDLKAQIASPTLEKFQRNNVLAQKNLLDAYKATNVRNLIFLSSSVVISVASDDYTNTKKKGEELVKKSGIPYTILRPPLMYGCFDAKHLGYITKLMEKTPMMPIPGHGHYMRQPLYVLDMCRVIMACIEREPKNTIHNIIGYEKIDFIDILREIKKQRRLICNIAPLPLPIFKALLKVYSTFTGRPAFTQQQLDALMAGDDFPVEEWTKEFDVPYTPFKKALKETYASKYYTMSRKMVSPH
jgi:nucleoside-diphosphate-sugar epimerase